MKNYKEDMEPDNDVFVEDDTYEEYAGPDLSDDPMAVGEGRKGRQMSRRGKKHRLEQERLERQRAAIKAEILAEMEEERRASKGTDGSANDGDKEPAAEDTSAPRRRGRFSEYLMTFLSGNILSKSEVRKVYPYLLFVAFLAFLYIGNVFRMQHLYRKHEKLTVEVRELRAKSLTIAAQKMNATRQSNIMLEIERRGIPLRESLTPNKVIKK